MAKQSIIGSAIALIMGATLLIPATAFAQRELEARIDQIAQQQLPNYKTYGSTYTGSLNTTQNFITAMSRPLTANYNYGFIAVCSSCTDIKCGC